MKDTRMLGVLIGVGLAIAGAAGIAVGTYSLPDPMKMRVDAGVYVRANQYARGVFDGTLDGVRTRIEVEALRGASAGANLVAPPPSIDPQNSPNANSYFSFIIKTCAQSECDFPGCYEDPACTVQEYGDAVSLSAFTFDPALAGARFQGNVQGCAFDVTWTGEGETLPFVQHQERSGVGEGHIEARIDGGVAELSRVAPVSIDWCSGSLSGVNGYVAQGLRNWFFNAQAFEQQPED